MWPFPLDVFKSAVFSLIKIYQHYLEMTRCTKFSARQCENWSSDPSISVKVGRVHVSTFKHWVVEAD